MPRIWVREVFTIAKGFTTVCCRHVHDDGQEHRCVLEGSTLTCGNCFSCLKLVTSVEKLPTLHSALRDELDVTDVLLTKYLPKEQLEAITHAESTKDVAFLTDIYSECLNQDRLALAA